MFLISRLSNKKIYIPSCTTGVLYFFCGTTTR